MNADDKKLIDLLERWQSGNFSLREEQELQRLLQTDDTFAKDAAEGFLQYPEEDHTARLNRLHQKLRNNDRNTNPFFTTRIFSLAAALAFLLVAIWWMNRPDEKTNAVVSTTPASAPQVNEIEDSLYTTSEAPDGDAIVAAPPPGLKSAKKIPALDKRVSVQQGYPAPGSSNPPIAMKESEPQMDILKMRSGDIAGDKSRKDAAPESPAVAESDVAIAEDQKVYAPVTQAPPFQDYPRSTQNAVVTPEQMKRQSKKLSAPAPTVGWTQFRKEMKEKAVLTQAAKDAKISKGTVTMILDISNEGKVRSTLFVKRLGYGCDEVAEAFVQQYSWTVPPDGGREVEIEILFTK